MSREWVDDMVPRPKTGPDKRDKRWVMRCDCRNAAHGYGRGQEARCSAQGEPSARQPDLKPYADSGWFIAAVHGDQCPECRKAHPNSANPYVSSL